MILAMTITQTVEIPVSHRLTLEVPREIPAGRAILTFTPSARSGGDEAGIKMPPSYSPEEALRAAARRRSDPNRKSLSRLFGILSPAIYGDGVEYQRNMRDEWDD